MRPPEAWYEARNLMTQMLRCEQAELWSFATYTGSNLETVAAYSQDLDAQAATLNGWIDPGAAARGTHDFPRLPPWHGEPDAYLIAIRMAEFGPLTFQNDDLLLDRLGSERTEKIKLLDSEANRLFTMQDRGALYAYEIVNFVDGMSVR
jgi:hypothetical protein